MIIIEEIGSSTTPAASIVFPYKMPYQSTIYPHHYPIFDKLSSNAVVACDICSTNSSRKIKKLKIKIINHKIHTNNSCLWIYLNWLEFECQYLKSNGRADGVRPTWQAL